MKRKALQALCKKHNIPANTTNLQMANNLASLANQKPELGQLEGSDTSTSDIKIIHQNEFQGRTTRRAKNVRFCLEHEQNGFIDLTNSEDGNSIGKRKQKRKNLGIGENPKASKDVPVRITRSRRRSGVPMGDSSLTQREKLKRGYSDSDGNETSRSSVDSEVIVVSSSPENTVTRRRGKVKVGLDDGSSVDVEMVVPSSSRVEKMTRGSAGEKAKAGVEKPSSREETRAHAEVMVLSSTENKKNRRGVKAGAHDGLQNIKRKQQEIAVECQTQVGKGPTENILKREEKVPRKSKRKSSMMYNPVIPEGTELEQATGCSNRNLPSTGKSDIGISGTIGKKPYYHIMPSTEEPLRTSNSHVSNSDSAKNEEKDANICSFGFKNIVKEFEDVGGSQQDADVVQQLEKDLVNLKQDAVSETYSNPNANSNERICKLSVLLERISVYKEGKKVTEAESKGTSPHSNASNPFYGNNKEKVATTSNTVLVNFAAQRDEAGCIQPAQDMQDASVLPQLKKDPINGEEDTVGQQQAQKELLNPNRYAVSGPYSNYHDKDILIDKLIEEFEEQLSECLQIINARTSTLSEDSGSFNIVVVKPNENCEFQNNNNVAEDENDARLSELASVEFGAMEGDIVDTFPVSQECQIVHAAETEAKENAEIIHRISDEKNCENAASVSVLEEQMDSLSPGPEFAREYTSRHVKINIKKDEEKAQLFLDSAKRPNFQLRDSEVLSQVKHYSYLAESTSINNAVEENEEIAFNQLGILTNQTDRDGEADGYDFSAQDYPSHESYEDKLETSSGNKKYQTDLTHVTGPFQEKTIQFTSYGSEVHLGSAMVVQGNKIEACMQNRSPGESVEEKNGGEAVLQDKVDDANRDKDSLLPFIESFMDRSGSCHNFGEVKMGNEYQLELGSEAVLETVKRRRPVTFTMQRTPLRSSDQSQGHLSANGMKENIMYSKTENSSNRKVEKSLTKRRALKNLQNSLNR